MTVLTFLHALRRHLVMAIVIPLVVTVGAVGLSFAQTPMYAATAKLFAMYQGSSEGTSDLTNGASYIASQIDSYPDLVKTNAVLKPVINRYGLDDTVASLGERIDVQRPEGTMLLTITVTDGNAQRSAELANAVAQSLQHQVSSGLYEHGDQTDAVSPINLSVVDEALPPSKPSKPNHVKYGVVGMLAGVVLAVTAVVLRSLLDVRIHDRKDFAALVPDMPIFGELAKGPGYAGDAAAVIGRPGGMEADEIRRIRTNLLFSKPASADNKGNVLVVTSVQAGEGKTTFSVNLAAACAEAGRRVLLIDADLRHPSVADRLGITGSLGLAHVLTAQASFEDAVQQYWKANYSVLPAGRRTENPNMLIDSDGMRSLLKHVASLYDDVIVDTCPLMVGNDAALLARGQGNVIMLVGLGVEDRRELPEALEGLEMADVKPLGAVLNYAERHDRQGHYYGNYYHNADKRKKTGRRSAGRKK
ncbi:polysaccharide biosynthesis tyrosine autokinase [Bifidobacterium sp. CP2]|uniref:polysaccharide biosynthesis tyrosine autokinase n=1 Tax=Bifidobacterium TaxID=1678 RepID=UPI001BDD2545|nr:MULTISPECIES: polysaccharide biosynthesis tyrosine autokinase [Bifidobacterium]MBT1182136.1 polysaccharide biosynthesis tyrosine autokinase [Bifidobacterium sp. CP2]MBW3081507.1 polysaccharide biosynthesis tyrosine autokinase [Bifidobacterium saguinibicoloris]